jgi:NAD(P)H-hydrate epimerase
VLRVLTPIETRACDRAAIDAGTPEAVLVERAAGAVARAARRLLGGVYGRRVVVVAGKGNNGNDGRVAARMLLADGAGVDVFDLDAGIDHEALARAVGRAHLLIDAMYGTGFRGRLEGDAAMVAASGLGVARTLAIDVPSGVDALTGRTSGAAVVADWTVTFAALKPGLLTEPGRSHAGEIEVADIGVDPSAAGGCLHALEAADVDALVPGRDPEAHKWSAGVLVVAGSAGMTGAALLAGRGAYRAAAGMVVCALPGDEAARRASGGEVVTRAAPATDDGALTADAVEPLLAGIERFGALVVGPGLGRAQPTLGAVRQLVASAPVALVVDADAIVALGEDPAPLRERSAANLPPAVLTPHVGEFTVLAGAPPGDDRIDAARSLAASLGAVVLLKGPGTVVADPDGRALLTPTGGAGLATAGSGDVLAGVIGALLARGLEPFEAAGVGAWWHGRAGDLLDEGALASDVADALPRTLAAIRGAGGD